MLPLRFDNRFVRELPGDPSDARASRQVREAFWSRVSPTPVSAPRTIAVSKDVATLLGLEEADLETPDFAATFAGNELAAGMEPFAACYGGHQFGSWAGQLGDGRAISLGETVNPKGERWELQLKGAGPTPYSRRADGRAVLRSSIREFLCSEAMHHLGVPTTRALSLVATGDSVERDMFYDGHARFEPGAIVCRVSPSFIRFGNFELPSSRGEFENLTKLVDFTIDRDFRIEGVDPVERRARWFDEVCRRTASLIVHWMRVGFVHGVMNTDNMSILGLTIDYGPYGFVDNFDPGFTPNTTDSRQRRYRFGAQPAIAHWNLVKLAEALVPIFPTADALEASLDGYVRAYEAEAALMLARKLGFTSAPEDDGLVRDVFRLLGEAELDMTTFFRRLADVDVAAPSLAPLESAFYRDDLRQKHEGSLASWLEAYAAAAREVDQATGGSAARRARMNATNPRFILRNYLTQLAIDAAEAGDESMIHRLLDALRRPYADDPADDDLVARRPEWARHKAGCSMLSCSS